MLTGTWKFFFQYEIGMIDVKNWVGHLVQGVVVFVCHIVNHLGGDLCGVLNR